jgi:hypothetical protein
MAGPMRVRTYFLIAGATVLSLVAALTVTYAVFLWWISLSRPPFGPRFPAIVRWDTLKITLDRTFCYGTCPDYTVEIHGDGTVFYTGDMYVAVPGRHKTHIPVSSVRTLFEKFEAARFFATFDQYLGGGTDGPTYTVTIAFDDQRKVLEDYGGRSRWGHMPPEITELEHAIDAAANVQIWVKGEGDVVTALTAEHWDFDANSDENSKMLKAAKLRGDTALVNKLTENGQDHITPEDRMFMTPKMP